MSTFRLPDLGEGLAEAEIVAWHVKVGDQVRIDQPMVSVETAKAVVEVPAPFSGTVIALRGAPGDIVATGAPLIDFDSGTVVGSMPATSEEEFVESAGRTPGNGHGTAERTTNGSDAARARAIPAARALARHLNVDLAAVDASGRDGSVSIDDVLRHADISPTRASAASRSPRLARRPRARIAAARPEDGTVEPLRGMRRAMAQSMSLSRDQVAGSTVCDDADLHHWTHRGDYMLRLVRAMVCAWRSEPALNAWYDAAGHSRMLVSHMDLAIAVDTPDGLIVPVVRDVEKKSPRELRAAIAEQKEAAHRRATPPQDLRGFTLMLSNFGTLAGRYGIPRVVPPAVAILGAGKVREDAVAAAGKVEAHLRMPLSLSFDHRCITGGEACRYLGGRHRRSRKAGLTPRIITMYQASSEQHRKIVSQVIRCAIRPPKTLRNVDWPRFLHAYYANVDADDLAARDPKALAELALAHLMFAHQRRRSALVRVFNPTLREHGFTSPHTVIQMVNDDMPFLGGFDQPRADSALSDPALPHASDIRGGARPLRHLARVARAR